MTGRLRRIGAALAVALAVVGSTLPTSAAPQAADEPELALLAQTTAVGPDDPFTALIRVAGAPAGSDLAVDIFDRITDAEDLAQSTTLEPAAELDRFDPLPLDVGSNGETDAGFTIHLHDEGSPPVGAGAWAYRLTEPGVYPLRIRLRDPDGALLTSMVTYVIRSPGPDETQVAPASVALLVDVDAPLRKPLGTPAPVPAELREGFEDVIDVFDDHSAIPATFAVLPETAARLEADPAAASTHQAVTSAVLGPRRELLGAPYVDVNAADLLSADLDDELRRQIDLGRRTLRDTLTRSGTATWSHHHRLDPVTVDALSDAGVNHLVVPRVNLDDPPLAGPVTLSGTTPEHQLTAVTTGAVELPSGAVDDHVLATHQLLGRLAATSTSESGAAVVVEVDPSTVDLGLLDLLLTKLEERNSFLAPSTVSSLFNDNAPAPVSGRPVAPEPADPGRYPSRLRETRQLAASYGSMLAEPSQLEVELERQLATAGDAFATDDERVKLLDTIDQRVRSRFTVVSMADQDRVTLGARDATFPLTIRSSGAEPLRVVITLRSSDRLEFPQDRIEATLTGPRTVVEIPVRTRTSGDTPLYITVTTADGRIVLAESRYTVRSTAVSGVGILLTVGAAAFLAVWWARHWRRTSRERQMAADVTRSTSPGSNSD